MNTVSMLHLYLLRAMYLLIAVGLGLTIWPEILFPTHIIVDAHSVVRAMLGAMALLAVLGIRYPLQMLPILLFEILWKSIWLIASALPLWLNGELDTYAKEVIFACIMGVILTPIVIPWKYVYHCYVKAAADPWRLSADVSGQRGSESVKRSD